jgi:hypothetical protein
VRADLRLDLAGVVRQPAGDQREVLLLDRVALELVPNVPLGGRGQREQQAPVVSLSSRWQTRTRGSAEPVAGSPSCRPSASSTLSVSPGRG